MALTTASALMLGAAGVAATGGITAGLAASQQGNFAAKVQRQQAERAKQVAGDRARDFARQHSAMLARRRAGLGRAGVESGAGSPLMGTEDFAREVEFQRQRILQGGDVAATRLRQQATLSRAAGAAALTEGGMRGGASLLKGASSAFGG